MKKTYRIIGMMIVALIATISMTACSDDDDEPADPATHDQALVGKWGYDYNDRYEEGTSYLIFKKNGTFETRDEYYDKEDEENCVFRAGGNWTTENDKVTMHYTWDDEGDVEAGYVFIDTYSYTISGKTLYMQNVDDSYDNKMTLTRR